MFASLNDRHLMALYGGGWKRTKAFFRHPRDMIALRHEMVQRGLLK